MPTYTYTAKSQPYKTIQGSIEAENEQDAIHKLTKMGYFPVSIRPAEVLGKEGIFALYKISKKEIFLFTRQMSSLLDSGVNVINGINIISGQASGKYLVSVLNDIAGKIKGGKSLSESIKTYPHIFPDLYCSIVSVGEASGNLNESFRRLSGFLEKEEEFKDSLRAALAYPAFIFILSSLVIFVLLTFVIPRLVTMFQDMGQMLPLPTRILIGVSSFLRSYGWIIILASFLLLFILRRALATGAGKLSFDKIKLKAFIFGPIILKTEISRLTRTLALLLSSGVPIINAFDTSISVVNNQVIKAEARKLKDRIASGSGLSEALKNSKIFPEIVTSVLAVGEETGSLDKSLIRVADDYEREVNRTLSALTRLIEPAIILLMGLIVGFIVISMLMPIFQINLIVK